ncbi:MAG: molybdopterin-guanine dinucleotide biosynthesis protein B [Candidatus Bathyarchaeota archaeon]
MLPVVSIVGKTGSGKTQLIERLIPEFKRRGYRVATVKHSPGGMEVDKPGKDSWRFAEAGSDAVVVSSPDKLACIKTVDHDSSIEEIWHLIGTDFDLVLFEGFKKGKAPKIEAYRKELREDLLCPAEVLSAIVTDEVLDINVPQFPPSDTQAIADFIEKISIFQAKSTTSLFINGKQVFIKPFVKDIIAKALLAMVSTLKGVGEIKNLDISIRNKP